MACYKFLVLTLFVTCLSIANSAPFSNKDYAQSETVIPNDETDAKEPEQYGGGYNSGKCRYGCCYRGSYGCIRCCRYPNEEPNTVETSKRGRGGCKYGCCGSYAYGQCSACCSRTQVAKEANEQNQP